MSVKSAQRVLDILQMFAAEPDAKTLAKIARTLKQPKSSCLAILQTLERSGYLYQLDGGRYYPTTRWLADARAISGGDKVVMRVQPILEALRNETGETVLFAKRLDTQSLYLQIVESRQILRYTADVGQLKPLHCSASGHALLGGMDPDERETLIRRLPMSRMTDHTITRRKELSARIAASSERGWYCSLREYHPETAAVGVPMRIDGEVYAILVAAPYHRLRDRMDEVGGKLISASRIFASDNKAISPTKTKRRTAS
jgi:DNA-binding IclR family transcriptional regulator